MFYQAKVVNNKDPENLQRIQVRILGIHSFDEGDIPDNILPWAEPALPLQGKVDGGYGKFEVPEAGDWVWCFFTGETVINRQFPYYFAIIRTPKDKNVEYIQGVNEFEKDRFDNRKLIDDFHTEWENGKKTAKFEIDSDGNIKVFSSNSKKAIIDMGGENGRSSSVNYTNLDKWMKNVETILQSLINHVHTGNLGYPTTPELTQAVDQSLLTTTMNLIHPTVESKKLKIPSYEDSL